MEDRKRVLSLSKSDCCELGLGVMPIGQRVAVELELYKVRQSVFYCRPQFLSLGRDIGWSGGGEGALAPGIGRTREALRGDDQRGYRPRQ